VSVPDPHLGNVNDGSRLFEPAGRGLRLGMGR
jgi:hypothetical protein